MRPRVKICGITGMQDALACSRAGADFLGFIFYEKSPRYVTPEKAKGIIKDLPPRVVPVGVFVNEEREKINEIVASTGIRIIQLGGDETPDDCTKYDARIWKSFRIRNPEDVAPTVSYKIDAAILDGAPDGEYGGSGMRASDLVALRMKSFHRLVLAGGITPENVVDAGMEVQPYAIDINSGVESSPGKKNHARVKELFKQINLIT